MENSSNPDSSATATKNASDGPAGAPDTTGTTDTTPERKGVSGLQVLQSTLAAALGVQSRKNRERDFQEGKASQFIFAGILFTLLFIGVMVIIVRTVLSNA